MLIRINKIAKWVTESQNVKIPKTSLTHNIIATLYICFLKLNEIVSHTFSLRKAVQRRVITIDVSIARRIQTGKYPETVYLLRA